ncbi:MAG: hypothetical protein RL472_45 [Pseudomonadota bacterium]
MRYIISFLLASIAPAYADVPRVVTDLPPVHSLVSQVMGDLGQPQLLLERGANAHDFQMRPSQAAALQEAELVVWVGPEMTPWLDRALLGLSGARQLQLLADAKTYRQDYGTTHGNHDDEDDPEHIGLDPHAWLDPTNAVVWLDLIAENLATLDPEHAATYIGNAARAKTDLALLDARIAAQLAPERGKWLVVYHDAYGYFSHHYGLTVVAALAEGDAVGPGAQHIAQIEALLRTGKICLFSEVNHDPKLVIQLANASGLRSAGALDPEGASYDLGPALYGQLLRGLADSIAACGK